MGSARLAVSVLLALGLLASPARGEPCTSAASCSDRLPLSTGKSFPYYRSMALARSDAVEWAVIVVHGTLRDADAYFERLVRSADAEGRLDDTLLVAPSFRTADDGPGADEHYWSSGGWKIGHSSRDEPGRYSSFAVMNELLARVCSRATFPGIRGVVIVGHSAGGQFVNRYAAGGAGCPDPVVPVRYVVMNPSSYLYVAAERVSDGGELEVPDRCPEYDDYKYGMRDLNSYMSDVGVEAIRENLFTRETWYFAGEKDTSTSGSLDVSCSGNLQGTNRLDRLWRYRIHAGSHDGWSGSSFSTVPGIGHSSSKMLMSGAVRAVVFGLEPAPAPLPPTILGTGP